MWTHHPSPHWCFKNNDGECAAISQFGRKKFGGGAVKLPLDVDFVQGLVAEFSEFVGSREAMNESLMLFEMVPYKKVRAPMCKGGVAWLIGCRRLRSATRRRVSQIGVITIILPRASSGSTLSSTLRSAISAAHFWQRRLRPPALSRMTRSGVSRVLARMEITLVSSLTLPYIWRINRCWLTVDVDIPASAIYGSNAKKLTELKDKYDPDNLFSRGLKLGSRPVVVVNQWSRWVNA